MKKKCIFLCVLFQLNETVTTTLDNHVKNYNTSNSSMLIMDMLQKRVSIHLN